MGARVSPTKYLSLGRFEVENNKNPTMSAISRIAGTRTLTVVYHAFQSGVLKIKHLCLRD